MEEAEAFGLGQQLGEFSLTLKMDRSEHVRFTWV